MTVQVRRQAAPVETIRICDTAGSTFVVARADEDGATFEHSEQWVVSAFLRPEELRDLGKALIEIAMHCERARDES